MKNTPLQRKTPLRAKTGFKKRSPLKKGVKKKKVRTKLPSVQLMRKKADKLLTPIIKAVHPNCLLCGGLTQVAHHHIKKSTSNACRYYIPNLIPLCNPCHQRLHNDELYWCGRVIQIKGMDWLLDLERQKKVEVKTDVHFYIHHHQVLSNLLEKL